MKSNYLQGRLFVFALLLSGCMLLPILSNAQIILETKGKETPIRVFGAEKIKIFGGLKHSQEANNGDQKQAQLNFLNPNSQLLITDTLFNATGFPLFIKTNSGADSSHVIFQSTTNAQQYLIGDSINFYKVTLDQSLGDQELVLTSDITLRDTLKMESGRLFLNDKRLTLVPEESDNFTLSDPQPYIFGEDSLSFIWDTLSGAIYLDICVPQNEINNTSYNFGGLGTALQVPDNTINGEILSFTRSYGSYPIDTLNSIYRRYEISGVDEIIGGVDYNFNYQSHDLLTEHEEEYTNLVLYRSKDDGLSWKNFLRDSSYHDLYNRMVEKEGIDSLAGIWTLAPCPDPPVIALPDTGDIYLCAYDTLWLDVGLSNVSVLWSDSSTLNPYPFVAENPPFGELTSFNPISVEVRDDRGCSSVWRNTIIVQHAPIPDLIATDSSEFCETVDIGGVNAYIDPFYTYTYEWQDGATGSNYNFPLNPPGESTYWVTATFTDVLTCSNTDTVEVIIYPFPEISLPDTTAFSCDGSPVVLSVEEYPGANYQWYDVETAIPDANGATYEVPPFIGSNEFLVVVDYNGVCFDDAMQNVFMSNLALNATVTDILCNGDDNGQIEINVTGGEAGYATFFENVFTENMIFPNLTPDTYTLELLDDFCSVVDSFTITEPPVLSATLSVTNIDCSLNGQINLSPSGGVGPYTFLWSTGAMTEDLVVTNPGMYSVTITDNNLCSQSYTAEVLSTADLVLSQNSVLPVSCNGLSDGAISVSTSGGLMPYSFDIGLGSSTDSSFNNLSAGTYMITVTDANNCTDVLTVEVTEPPAILVQVNTTNAECGESNGAAMATASGGTGTLSFFWPELNNPNPNVNALSAGIYTLIVSDATTCADTSFVSIANIGGPVLDMDPVINSVSCFGLSDGSITVNATGGTGTLTYTWNTNETGVTINNLSAGNYSVTVTDTENCQDNASILLTEPDILTIILNPQDIECNEELGAITTNVTGGTPDYTYAWSNGPLTLDNVDLTAGNYTLTVTDANGCMAAEMAEVMIDPTNFIFVDSTITPVSCLGQMDGAISLDITSNSSFIINWNTGQVGASINNLGAGLYTATITNSTCVEVLNLVVPDAGAILINADVVDVSCNGLMDGGINTNVSGGSGTYNYNWSTGASTTDVAGLSAGLYSLTITDTNNCVEVEEILVLEPDSISLSIDQTLAGCQSADDGSINVTVEGGVPDYFFNWSNGASTEDLDDLSVGVYTVTVSDQNACEQIESIALEGSPEPFEALFLAATPVNYGDTIFFVDVSFPAPIAWDWFFDDPDNSTSTDPNPTFAYPQDTTGETSFYDVRMIASTEFCRDTIIKTIEVYNFRNGVPEPDTNFIKGAYFEHFKVYPNPTDGRILVDAKLKQEGDVQLYLSDLSGKQLRIFEMRGADEYLQTIDLGQLPAGLYLFTGAHKDDYRTVKLIVVEER